MKNDEVNRVCPNTQDYVKAFEAIKEHLSHDQRRLIFAHVASPELTASIDELYEHTECVSVEEAEKQYALIGRALSAHLEFRFPPEENIPDRLQLILALATPLYWTGGSVREWKLRTEVINALTHAKL